MSAACLLVAAALIARSPEAPIRRPPNDRDELTDSRDYYPDALLASYRRAGVNGVWMLVEPASLATNAAALAKLESIAAKCGRYGIGVWPLMIEAQVGRVICPSDTNDLAFVRDRVGMVFHRVPTLRGLIALTHGERDSTCLLREKCPRCATGDRAALHTAYVTAIRDGVKAANPKTELIDWFYHPEADPGMGRPAWLPDAIRLLPKDVIVQYNFESGLAVEQLGKLRFGGDYWLSQPGPSEPFSRVAQVARASGHRLSAKIQTSCSHELATLPYVPVPGLLYRKFKAMAAVGVTDAQLCWFFGGSPGLMMDAVGLLAGGGGLGETALPSGGPGVSALPDEEAFLRQLAGREGVPASEIGRRVECWKKLADGYSLYPVSNMFQYYGPVHAGATWPLLADVAMAPLPRSWKPQDEPHGDLLGECLENHTLDEAYGLLDSAVEKMKGAAYDDLSRAFVLQFEIARDILLFYRLRRHAVVVSRGKAFDAFNARVSDWVLREMIALVRATKARRAALRELAERNPAFGYHPESEDRRYDPEKIARAETSLDGTAARLEAIRQGLATAGYPLSERERTASSFTNAVFAADGSLGIDFPVPNPDRTVRVWLYDVCGTERALAFKTRPTDGRLKLRIGPENWGDDGVRRPGWILVEQGAWRFPADPGLNRRESRLGLWHLDGDRFARIVASPGVTPKEPIGFRERATNSGNGIWYNSGK